MTALLDTAALLAIAIGAALYLNATRGLPWLDRIAFAITGAGALGLAIANWVVPGDNVDELATLLFHVGAAIVAFVFVRPQLEELLERLRETRDRLEASLDDEHQSSKGG